jgi:hypothetical protein
MELPGKLARLPLDIVKQPVKLVEETLDDDSESGYATDFIEDVADDVQDFFDDLFD